MKHLKKYNESKKDELRTISDLIDYLEEVKAQHGDIAVCHSEDHEYWGSYQTWLKPEYNLGVDEHAQPDGPKSGKSVKALVFGK